MTSLTTAGGTEERPGRHKVSLAVPSQHSRARSPVTVQEWVAALPDNNQQHQGDEDEKEEEQEEQEVEEVKEMEVGECYHGDLVSLLCVAETVAVRAPD